MIFHLSSLLKYLNLQTILTNHFYVRHIVQLQLDLNSLLTWILYNILSFNLSKFVLWASIVSLILTQYIVEGHEINVSSSCKDLGVIFTDSLSWEEHYKAISSKAYKSLGLLRRVFKDLHCSETRKSLYIY